MIWPRRESSTPISLRNRSLGATSVLKSSLSSMEPTLGLCSSFHSSTPEMTDMFNSNNEEIWPNWPYENKSETVVFWSVGCNTLVYRWDNHWCYFHGTSICAYLWSFEPCSHSTNLTWRPVIFEELWPDHVFKSPMQTRYLSDLNREGDIVLTPYSWLRLLL